MSDIFAKYAALRGQYPSDIETIEAEEERVKSLLSFKAYSELPETQELMALCRKDIVFAQVRLATDRTLTEEARRELWFIVEAREWFLKQVARDFDAELAMISSQ